MDISTIIFLLLAIVAWGMGAFFDKMTLRYVDSSSAFYLRTLFIMAMSVPVLVWKFFPTRQALFGSHKLALLFIVSSVVVTMGGVFFYLKAMSGGEASKIVPLSSTYPFVTFIMVCLFLGESVTVSKVIGTVLISGGIYFISK